ncbi:WD repeat-containing protein, putative [Entamoeba invadens IP1]|uniref:WD repeat-containing protein, putative n=1 Tax=Entamoeba invadens IP1 TaxID=370355 RepID=A0A0A1U0U6_ENTIV|nr:WD repeat-containing protein, putative [Entamoeba invadens IP1]ELP87524.1 WD repeat-containing protein, putative [Entamoeba invadens IP1]|eukprot:XP_004254295.1 WD repeat-containing protein, putative [Entamoeba invadens IP1]
MDLRKGGHIGRSLIFGKDNRTIITTEFNCIIECNIKTGEVVSKMPFDTNVVALIESDSDQFFVALTSGRIDLVNGEKMETVCTWEIGKLIHRIEYVAPKYFFIRSRSENFVFELDMNTSTPNFIKTENGIPSCDGSYMYTSVKDTVICTDLNTEKKMTFAGVDKKRIVMLKQHPTDPLKVYAQTVNGMVVLISFDPNVKDADYMFTSFHWHSIQFEAMAIYTDATKLLTGGKEGVLVIWSSPKEKEFVSGLGSKIKAIYTSKDNRYAAVVLGFNTISIIDLASQRIVKEISGVYAVENAKMCNAIKGQIVIYGDSPTLQVFDPMSDRQMFKADVSRPNVIILALVGETLPDAHIQHVAFVDEDSWMVTYDTRNVTERYKESHLRFFKKQPSGAFEQMLIVPEPTKGMITSIVSSRSGKYVVTTSQDHLFKIWVLSNRETQQSKGGVLSEVMWKCRSIGAYYGEESYSATFSNDGSVLGVMFQNALTFWDVQSNKIMCCIPCKSTLGDKMYFMANNRYVLTTNSHGVVAWDVLSRSVNHIYNVKNPKVVVHDTSSLFAMLFKENPTDKKSCVALFDVEQNKKVREFEVDETTDLTFFKTVTDVEYILTMHSDLTTSLLSLEDVVEKTPKEVFASKKEEETKGIEIRKLEVDDIANQIKTVKIVGESTLDALETNMADINHIFNVVVNCLLK